MEEALNTRPIAANVIPVFPRGFRNGIAPALALVCFATASEDVQRHSAQNGARAKSCGCAASFARTGCIELSQFFGSLFHD